MNIDLRAGDSLELLKTLEDNSIDSIVTDPPYGLSFMNKKWDYDVPSYELWTEALRVLKPGGHCVSFSGTRTYHRMVVAMEDAGFEIRDQIQWLYGSGFPKSHNIGKAYDKKMGNEREDLGPNKYAGRRTEGSGPSMGDNTYGEYDIPGNETKGTSPYEGWGTALKPANEPIVLARKPLSEKTIVDNVIKWGTGGINIDASRVASNDNFDNVKDQKHLTLKASNHKEGGNAEALKKLKEQGRFPANVIHDGSEEVLELFPHTKTGAVSNKTDNNRSNNIQFNKRGTTEERPANEGSAARFFYCAKVSKKERNVGLEEFEDTVGLGSIGLHGVGGSPTKDNKRIMKNNHPTVKPVALMSYLCRLITPTGGTVLDPFNGSGSTGMAAKQEGFNYIGFDLSEEYIEISKARIKAWEQ